MYGTKRLVFLKFLNLSGNGIFYENPSVNDNLTNIIVINKTILENSPMSTENVTMTDESARPNRKRTYKMVFTPMEFSNKFSSKQDLLCYFTEHVST